MHLTIPHGQSGPFLRSIKHRSVHTLFRQFLCAITQFFGDFDSDVQNADIFFDVLQDFVYAVGFLSRPVRFVLNFKQASKCAYPPFRL